MSETLVVAANGHAVVEGKARTHLYVVGFLTDGKNVVLIRKNRPEWQADRLNGVGGHVEPGELPYAAMLREFQEEAGLTVPGWQHMFTMHSGQDEIWFFRARVSPHALSLVSTRTDEDVCVTPLEDIQTAKILPNLHWILPFVAYRHDKYEPFEIREVEDAYLDA